MLAMIRCLAATGSRVTAVATTRTAPGLWSRGPERRRVAPDPRVSVDGFLAALQRVVADGSQDALLAGADASLLAISGNRERFAGRVQLGLPGHDVVLRSLDKDALVAAAAEAGLPVPEGRVCETTADALARGRAARLSGGGQAAADGRRGRRFLAAMGERGRGRSRRGRGCRPQVRPVHRPASAPGAGALGRRGDGRGSSAGRRGLAIRPHVAGGGRQRQLLAHDHAARRAARACRDAGPRAPMVRAVRARADRPG